MNILSGFWQESDETAFSLSAFGGKHCSLVPEWKLSLVIIIVIITMTKKNCMRYSCQSQRLLSSYSINIFGGWQDTHLELPKSQTVRMEVAEKPASSNSWRALSTLKCFVRRNSLQTFKTIERQVYFFGTFLCTPSTPVRRFSLRVRMSNPPDWSDDDDDDDDGDDDGDDMTVKCHQCQDEQSSWWWYDVTVKCQQGEGGMTRKTIFNQTTRDHDGPQGTMTDHRPQGTMTDHKGLIWIVPGRRSPAKGRTSSLRVSRTSVFESHTSNLK